MDRREFLRRATYYTVAAAGTGLAACAAISDEPQGSFAFTHGVASGDPKPSSIVFWTRCVRVDKDREPVTIGLQVSTSPGFETTTAATLTRADPAHDFTVRVKITGLAPDTRYYYRFIAGNDVSTTGRAATAPGPGSTRTSMRFAWISCQDWGSNHWGAMELLVAEDLDFVVHLGDYIYEAIAPGASRAHHDPHHTPFAFPDGRPLPWGNARYAASLEDYRTLYRVYRSDPRLQALHARFPMIVTWDDHEFSDDGFGANTAYRNDNQPDVARRRAATQAWAEYMPIDFGDVAFDPGQAGHDNIRIYRNFEFGPLLDLVLTDSRLFRDDHAVRESDEAIRAGTDPQLGMNPVGSRYFVPIARLREAESSVLAQTGRLPSILGEAQTRWWRNIMANSDSVWRVWANATTLNRMWLRFAPAEPGAAVQDYAINCDCWDGYPGHRRELLKSLQTAGVTNTVAISGDIHAFQCGVVRDDPENAAGAPRLVDFVTAGLSSGSYYYYLRGGATGPLVNLAPMVRTAETFDSAMRAANPDLRFVDHDAQGYATMTVEADRLVVVFTRIARLQADGSAAPAPVAARTRIVLLRNSMEPQISPVV